MSGGVVQDEQKSSIKRTRNGWGRLGGAVVTVVGAMVGGGVVRWYQTEHPHVAAVPIETGADLLSRCQSSDTDASLSCLSFIRTVVQTEQSVAQVRPDACFFRVPDSFTILEARSEIVPELQHSQNPGGESATSAVIAGLRVKHPCT